jgi:uncharacterized alpha-E superfamily protein
VAVRDNLREAMESSEKLSSLKRASKSASSVRDALSNPTAWQVEITEKGAKTSS